jgi:hypothetical protein
MKAQEFLKSLKKSGLKTFAVKIKLRQPGYTNIIDTTVQARNAEMARRILKSQYNNPNVIIGQPREVKIR